MPDLITIDDINWMEHTAGADILPDGMPRSTGLVPRNFATHPVGYLGELAAPFDLPLIPRNEWMSRNNDNHQAGALLSSIRDRGMYGQRIPAQDQNGYGYCWCFSSVSCALLLRAADNQPFADLSAFGPASIIKNYRNRGGWGAESLEWIAENGCPTSATWPHRKCERKYDTPEMRAEARLYRVTEWMDLDPRSPQFIDQFVTCLLIGLPVVSDFNWWGHSVATMDFVRIDPADIRGSLITLILNSWGDGWSENGAGQLKGNKAIPNGALAPRVVDAPRMMKGRLEGIAAA